MLDHPSVSIPIAWALKLGKFSLPSHPLYPKNTSGTRTKANPMSDPTAPQHPKSQCDPREGLWFALADQLIPFFYPGTKDPDMALSMAKSAIQAYQPETRADLANIARTIAFSMAALSLLGQAAEEPMTMPEKMRVYARAVSLNRSADQSERTMMQQRRYRHARADTPAARPPAPAPESGLTDAQIEAAVATSIMHAVGLTKTAKTEPAPVKSAPVQTAPEAPRPTVIPAAIRYTSPAPNAAQPRTAPHKENLLHHTAMPRVLEQTGAHPA
jgi:hypothetical protein